jgi:hypothetical protein
MQVSTFHHLEQVTFGTTDFGSTKMDTIGITAEKCMCPIYLSGAAIGQDTGSIITTIIENGIRVIDMTETTGGIEAITGGTAIAIRVSGKIELIGKEAILMDADSSKMTKKIFAKKNFLSEKSKDSMERAVISAIGTLMDEAIGIGAPATDKVSTEAANLFLSGLVHTHQASFHFLSIDIAIIN